ncbi:hypothetical protein ART_4098 [Arthrobacter sp. PAMC 25486]|nr:hypothetical protein ART_4098 [Arthrobacter sp. PAMC 25486]
MVEEAVAGTGFDVVQTEPTVLPGPRTRPVPGGVRGPFQLSGTQDGAGTPAPVRASQRSN